MLGKDVSAIKHKSLFKHTMLLVNEAITEKKIAKKVTSTKIRKSSANRSKKADLDQEERR